MKSLLVTCAGLNHLTSPVEEREKLAFRPDELPAALRRLAGEMHGAVLLSTCNRTELYTTARDGEGARLIDLLARLKQTEIDRARLYVRQHRAAVEHLFRVAAGIDSMVLGESQILGQVRDAMSAADSAGTLNGALSRAFHSAIAVGKRARTDTHIGRHAVSVSSAAVALARKHAGELADKMVLVISAGGTGKLVARTLARDSGARILVANRTAGRATALAAEIGPRAEGLPLSRLAEGLARADVVISGTGAGGFVVGAEQVGPAVRGRSGTMVLIDVAVPRDIDPAVRTLPNVLLFDIDDVEAVSTVGLNGRRREVRKVEAIIQEELDSFLAWWETLDAVPVIAALRERAETIRLAELERTFKRLPALDEESRRRIEAMTGAIVKKMLDRPITRLKNGVDKALYMEALEDLFDVQAGRARGAPRA
jgi:glutamyl-tRNA reductase